MTPIRRRPARTGFNLTDLAIALAMVVLVAAATPLYLTLKTQEITADVFVCPMSVYATPWKFDGLTAQQKSNFPGRQSLSYAYCNPYPAPAAVSAGWKFNNSLGPDFVFAADMGPSTPTLAVPLTAGREQMTTANSPNHRGEGQNVVYCDAHVEYSATPYCGSPRPSPATFRDHIYTYGSSLEAPNGIGVIGAPQDPFDAVLLPPWTGGFHPPAPAVVSWKPSVNWMIGATALLFVLVLAGALVLMLRRRGTKPVL